MVDLLSLKPMQLDALREVANIGAGHAATALSQMTGQTIMIAVPTINITPLEEVPPSIAAPDEPVAAVLMMVALTRKVRLLPRGKARVCEIAPLPLAGQVAPPLPLQVQLRSVSSGGTVCAIVTPATSISALVLLTVTV